VDTIYALSTGLLPSGVAIIRISGPGTRFACETMCGSLPEPRYTALRSIRRRNGDVLDEGLVLCFPGPHSFTGEDCVEFQLHGSRAVVTAVLNELSAFPGLREAEPGEFTRRAFENGRMDLTEVEGLSDLIAAQTEYQRRLALEASQGRLRQLYEGWSQRLLQARAWIEAEFDFADEDDVPDSMQERVWPDLALLVEEIDRHLAGAGTAERLRSGFRVVLAGAVNAGKSSLLNALARRDAAIVSPVPGTTRDIISVDLDIGGYPVTLTDTAGLRDTDDVIEREGVTRAQRAMASADLILHLIGSEDDDRLPEAEAPVLHVMSKCDMRQPATVDPDVISVSSVTGIGLDQLVAAIKASLSSRYPVESLAAPFRTRQIECLKATRAAAAEALQSSASLELRAEHLRVAQEHLGRITGRVSPDDLLGHIFAEFCIGK
jgi:tRNA modification GTPase